MHHYGAKIRCNGQLTDGRPYGQVGPWRIEWKTGEEYGSLGFDLIYSPEPGDTWAYDLQSRAYADRVVRESLEWLKANKRQEHDLLLNDTSCPIT